MATNGDKKPLAMALSSGSRGDCQPILAVLLKLKDKGFDVVFFTNPEHEELTKGVGIEHVPNGNNFKPVFTSEAAAEVFQKDDFLGWNAMATAHDMKVGKQWYTQLHKVLQECKPDLLLTGVNHWVDIVQLPLLYRIPVLHLHLANSFTYDPDKAPMGLPSAPPGENKPIWDTVFGGYLKGIEAGQGSALEELTGKPKEEWFPTLEEFQEICGNFACYEDIGSFMPAVFLLEDESRLHTDRPWFVFTGSPQLPAEKCKGDEFGEAEGEAKALEDFLGRCKEPPVYLGWGSVTCGKAGEMTTRAVRALKVLDRCGIILGGWAGLALDLLDAEPDAAELRKFCADKVLFVKTANHGALFPKCAAIVHHGGVGTTGASIRSGRPVVVTPIFYDQWDSGDYVAKIGVGVKTEHLGKLSPEDLAGYIKQCLTSEAIQKAAKEYKAKIEARDGAEEAAKVIRTFWDETVLTGKYWAGFDKILARKKNNLAVQKSGKSGCCFGVLSG